jgi:hypothetical protein
MGEFVNWLLHLLVALIFGTAIIVGPFFLIFTLLYH